MEDFLLLEKELIEKVKSIEEFLPCNLIVHRLPEFSIVYLSQTAKSNLGIPVESEHKRTFEEYFSQYFDYEMEKIRAQEALVRMNEMSDDENFTFFQHVKTIQTTQDFDCFICSTKVFLS